VLFYRAALPLSRPTLIYVAGVIRRHRRQIGSCWRKLNPGQQALLALAHLRKGETFAALAACPAASRSTNSRPVIRTSDAWCPVPGSPPEQHAPIRPATPASSKPFSK
jgi:hypothetical protein